MTDWKHPTNPEGKVPETVCLVAMGPSKSSWIQDRIRMDPQIKWDELWTLNAGCNWVHGHDLVFWMDDMVEQLSYEGTRHKLAKTTAPLITSVAYKGIESGGPVLEYPLGHVLSTLGPAKNYFQNSVPYIIAYAIVMGVKRLLMFGVDYDYPGIGIKEHGRSCCEWWCGFADAKGMQIQVPDTSTLLGANNPRRFYGYARQPIIEVARDAKSD